MRNKIPKINYKVIIIALLLAFLPFTILIWNYQATAQINPNPTYDLSIIEFYKQQLTKVAANGNDPVGQKAVLDKLHFAIQEATQYALVTPAAKDPYKAAQASLPVLPTMVIPTGIFNHGSGVYKPSEVTITSSWQGYVNGNLYQIEVGALVSDPTQGVVYFRITGPDYKIIDKGRIFTPEKVGAVTITDMKSGRLILRTDKEASFFFDVQAKQYATSLNGPLISRSNTVQTLTPIPYP